MLQNDSLKFLVFAHHLLMLQACTEAVIENKVCYHLSIKYFQDAISCLIIVLWFFCLFYMMVYKLILDIFLKSYPDIVLLLCWWYPIKVCLLYQSHNFPLIKWSELIKVCCLNSLCSEFSFCSWMYRLRLRQLKVKFLFTRKAPLEWGRCWRDRKDEFHWFLCPAIVRPFKLQAACSIEYDSEDLLVV